jgi:hypothetical protein
MLGWSRAIVPWSSPHTQCQHTPPRPPTTPPYIYITHIYAGRQRGSGACGNVPAWQGGRCADWSGHGGGAGRERLPRPGHLCDLILSNP